MLTAERLPFVHFGTKPPDLRSWLRVAIALGSLRHFRFYLRDHLSPAYRVTPSAASISTHFGAQNEKGRQVHGIYSIHSEWHAGSAADVRVSRAKNPF